MKHLRAAIDHFGPSGFIGIDIYQSSLECVQSILGADNGSINAI